MFFSGAKRGPKTEAFSAACMGCVVEMMVFSTLLTLTIAVYKSSISTVTGKKHLVPVCYIRVECASIKMSKCASLTEATIECKYGEKMALY